MGGIGSIIGALSFLGFLLFLAGIGLVVMSVSQGRPVRNGIVLAIAGLIAGVLLSVVSQGILIVQPTEAAVVFNVLSGELEDPPLLRGTHIIIPVIQETTIYPISQQSYTMSQVADEGQRRGDDAVSTRSFDGQEILMDITTIYQIDQDQVNQVHVDWNTVPGGYVDGFIRPTVHSIVRDIVADFRAESIYAGGRVELQNQIEDVLREEFDKRGFTLTSLLVRNVTFAPQFATAIEEKQIEEQRLQRAETEADRIETEARGQAQAVIARAEGDAAAVRIAALAEAEALRLVSEQIAANPNLIPYQYVQRLSDNVSLALIPSNSPFLFDINTFTALEGFTAPETAESTQAAEDATEATAESDE